jgi:hypothetical protein
VGIAGLVFLIGLPIKSCFLIFLSSVLDILSLGVGLVFASSYELLEDIQLIAAQPEISHVMILMCLTFLVGLIAGYRKYR